MLLNEQEYGSRSDLQLDARAPQHANHIKSGVLDARRSEEEVKLA
jgi:hypothetical protein